MSIVAILNQYARRGSLIYIADTSRSHTSVESRSCLRYFPFRAIRLRSPEVRQTNSNACANRRCRGCGSEPNRRIIIVVVRNAALVQGRKHAIPSYRLSITPDGFSAAALSRMCNYEVLPHSSMNAPGYFDIDPRLRHMNV
jgi:hypothetical protein